MATQMFSFSSGSLSAPHIDSYNFSGDDFAVSLMLQPRSGGTIISTGSFDLMLSPNGALQFSVYRSTPSQSTRIISDSTTLINTTQCNIVTCLAPLSGPPSIYLDGRPLRITAETIGQAPASNQNVFIGNNPSQNNQYTGGIMNVGLWNRILNDRELILAGYGQVGDTGIGPVALWFLNNSFADDSFNKNDLQATNAANMFVPCFNCINLNGPNSYSFCQIEGLEMQGPASMINYTQNVRVGCDAVALCAIVTDHSGYANFPDGVFVQITGPAGRIYNQDTTSADTAFFVKTQTVAGYSANSLFSLLINNPREGIWTVSITAPSNVSFFFQMQAYPARDIIPAQVTTLQDVRQHGPRAFHLQGWGSFLLGSALFLIGAVVLVSTSGTGGAAAAALMGIGLGIIVGTTLGAPVSAQAVTVKPPVLEIHDFILKELNDKHSGLLGKVWDTALGKLNGNWILQSGSEDAEASTIMAFKNLVNSAQNSIDILTFGSLGGQFKDELKKFITQRTTPLIVRIFSGISPDLEISASWAGAKKVYQVLIPGSSHVEKAHAIFTGLVDVNNIPGHIDLFVGAGDVPCSLLANIAVTNGWEHHKIIIVDGKKTIIGGMNFSEDSLKSATDPPNAVNDLSTVVEGGAAGSIQNFINSFWGNLFSVQLTSSNDFQIFQSNPIISGAYYAPPTRRLERKSWLGFALLTSRVPLPDIKSAITALNSRLPGARAASNDNVKIITAGRRSGYYYRDREPGDIAILSMIRRAESSLYISQQALGYPTATTDFVWDEAMLEIRQALRRGVSVRIIVSWTPDQEKVGVDGGYTSDQSYRLREKILTATSGVSGKLEIYNFPARNHAKIVVVDTKAVYIGSQNLYPTQKPILNIAGAATELGYLVGAIGVSVAVPAMVVIECLAYLYPAYVNAYYEVGLGECGIIVCDENKTNEFIATYWNSKWRIANRPR